MSDTSLVFNILAKDKASKVFDKVKGAAVAGGIAIGAALGAGVASALESSKVTAKLAAQLGATGAEAEKYGAAAGAVFSRGVAASMDDAAAAVKSVFQNGIVDENATQAELEAVSAQVVNLSTTMDEESGRVSAAVSQMLRTGMAGSAQEAMDILAAATQKGINKSEDLLDTFNEYGTQFRKIGLDGTTSMGLISQALQAGARDSDTVADSLKEFSIRAVDGSKSSVKAFQDLGLNAKAMMSEFGKGGDSASAAFSKTLEGVKAIKDPVKQAQVATALFGTKAEDLGEALFAMDLGKASGELGQVEGAAKRAGDTLEQSAGARLDSFKRRAQAALVDGLAKAVPYIEATFGWLSRNSAWVTPLAIGLGAFAAAIYVINAATAAWAVVQGVLNLAFLANPITWIILGVVALIAVIVLIATKTTWFQTAWKYTWNAIKAAFHAVIDFFVSYFKFWWGVYSKIFGFIKNTAVSVWRSIKSAFKTAVDWIQTKWTLFGKIFGIVRDKIVGKLSGMWSGLWGGFKSVVNKIIGAWNNLSFGIPGFSFAGMSFGGMSIGTPNIPYLAKGGNITQSGMAVVGERGPELLSLSRGAQVTPLSGGGRGGVWRHEFVVHGDREVVALFRRLIRTHNLLQGA